MVTLIRAVEYLLCASYNPKYEIISFECYDDSVRKGLLSFQKLSLVEIE